MRLNVLDDGISIQKRIRADDDNLIPLINIVFLLLIFFLVAGKVTPLAQMQVAPPASTSKKPVELSLLTITLDRNYQLFLDGQQIDVSQLSDLLNTKKHDGVNLYVDQTLTAKQLDTVLVPLREAGVAKMTLFSLMAEA